MKRIIVFGMLLLVLAACGGGTTDSPAAAVENYVKTRVTGDAQKLVELACKARESQARDEAASFAGGFASVESVSCQQSGTDGEFTVVACTGKMVKRYGAGETRELDLAARQFRAVQEDGRWRVCGYR